MSDTFTLDQVDDLVARIRAFAEKAGADFADIRGRHEATLDSLRARSRGLAGSQSTQLLALLSELLTHSLEQDKIMAKLDDELAELAASVDGVVTQIASLLTGVASLIDAVKAGGSISDEQVARLDNAQAALATAATQITDLNAQIQGALNPAPDALSMTSEGLAAGLARWLKTRELVDMPHSSLDPETGIMTITFSVRLKPGPTDESRPDHPSPRPRRGGS